MRDYKKLDRSISLAIRPFGFAGALDIPADYFTKRYQTSPTLNLKVAVGRKPSNTFQRRPIRRCSEVRKTYSFCFQFFFISYFFFITFTWTVF